MRRKLSIILCVALVLCMIPTTSVFAAKKIKSKSVSVAPKTMTIIVGDVVQLNATMKPANSTDKLSWSSSNKSVATVTNKGLVQGVAEGSATITVKTSSKKKATCKVEVKSIVDEGKLRESLKQEFATKNDVQSMISQNTYSKSEIDSKIAAIPSGGSGSSDFVDGVKVMPYEGMVSLPYTLRNKSLSVTVKSIIIKKYHYNSFHDGIFAPYKYVITIKGDSSQIPEGSLEYISLGMMDRNKNGSFGTGAILSSDDISSDNSFEKTVESYSSCNCDYYYLDRLEHESDSY